MTLTDTRGTTVVTDKAVRRIAGQLLGGKVGAKVTGERVSLDAELSVEYPKSVATATDRVRADLARDVAELTGLTVERVDITVVSLDGGGERRIE
ncbi:Asp23/Gls24 family envelope stress response protein [Amycolatopsis sp.]|uniref:Asp23/Gls24 family envelope stress response protein n=1 Tax=Amycolatopsis sp. TaxID=37632 RepID=UPI002CC17B90|nr:Asp23/Gls24 family envelope stress response protein [Amycolatopsis sp.]HVV07743.1 Asp23/Gls24 family envelope stress response protein [Amycolatopsis sp.]